MFGGAKKDKMQLFSSFSRDVRLDRRRLKKINRRFFLNLFLNSLMHNESMFTYYGNILLVLSIKHAQLHMCLDYHGADFVNSMLRVNLRDYFNKVD